MKIRESVFLSIMLSEKKSKFFLIAVIVGIAFSLAVILGTLGIMDGFEKTLKEGLKRSEGEVLLTSRSGFFDPTGIVEKSLAELDVDESTEIVQVEAFLLFNEQSKGVLVRGIEGKSFKRVTGLDVSPKAKGAYLGSALLKDLGIEVGQSFALTLADEKGAPVIERFSVLGSISHGLYEKDSRFIYLSRESLDSLLHLNGLVNLVLLNSPGSDDLEHFMWLLDSKFNMDYITKPYWFDFSTLLEAVKVEKVMIGLVLQVIVVVSLFNVIAFTSFLNEKRARDLFLLRALGLSQRDLRLNWLGLMMIIWGCGCLLSLAFVSLFRFSLLKLSFFELPGEVYHLARLKLEVGASDYLLVFGGAMIWLLLLSVRNFRKLAGPSILAGLRSEYAP